MSDSTIFGIIADRRSTKQFSQRPVEMDKILQIIQAGGLAPSSGNIQNWTFLIVTDTEKIRPLYDHTLQQEAFLSAMIAVIVCGDVEYAHSMYGMRGKRLYTIQNCAAAIENMLLAAQALDLGAIWVGAFDEDKIATLFDIPSDKHRPQAIILFGYPQGNTEEKQIKPLQDIIYFNTYGNKVLRPHLIYFDWATEWRNQAQKLHTKLTPNKSTSNTQQPKNDQQKSERQPNAENIKRRIRYMIDGLKRDEYRKK